MIPVREPAAVPRLAIKHLMIGVGLAAAILASYRSFDTPWFVLVCSSPVLALVVGLAVRRRPRLAAWTFGVAVVLENALLALISAYLAHRLAGLLIIVLWAAGLPTALAAGSAWARYRRPTPRRTGGWAWAVVVVVVLLPLTIPATLWPLRLAFALSRPALDRLADRVAAGEVIGSPEWAGVYPIVATRRDPTKGNVALLIDADPGGPTGFVRQGGPRPGSGPMLGLYVVPLGGPWRYFNDD